MKINSWKQRNLIVLEEDLETTNSLVLPGGKWVEEEEEEEEEEEADIMASEIESLIPTEFDFDPESLENNETDPIYINSPYDRHHRDLGMMLHDMHMPLTCNDGIDDWTLESCHNFSTLLLGSSSNNETTTTIDETIVIPCGQCYVVDITDGGQQQQEVVLSNGLRIEGKLYFPSTANVTIKTTYVFVLGLLKMDIPTKGNKVKFHLFGDELQTFVATSSDSDDPSIYCGGDGCNMGSKVISVHGGQLDIQGIEANCPAWEKLTAVGEGVVRPFIDHLPSENGASWTTDVVEVTGKCYFSEGHTTNLGKNTVWCPIKGTGAHIGSGTNLPIQLTSIGFKSFEYPTDSNDNTLSLSIRSACGRAGHTDAFGKCTIYCPVESTANIGTGYGGKMKFTSIGPASSSPPVYQLPKDSNGVEPTFMIKNKCSNSAGHTSAWGRCVLHCQLQNTANVGAGSPSWEKLQMTSKYHPPTPFPKPISSSTGVTVDSLKLASPCIYEAGHSGAWGGCVIRCPLESTYNDLGSYHSPARLNNPRNGEMIDTKRIIQWAHGGSNMYILLEDVSLADCPADGADALNNIFVPGDILEPSYRMVDDPSKDGSTFIIDRVMHHAHGGAHLFFFPSESDMTTCDATADLFNDGFLPGYEIEIDYPSGPPAGQTFNVDGVHHWAWGGSTMYFFPEDSDVATCSQTVSEFNNMFPKGCSIDIETVPTKPLGEVVTASQGVHHFSWGETGLYFFPDETDDEINTKFPVGYQLQMSYMDVVRDHSEMQVSTDAAACWEEGSEVLLTSHTRSMNDQQVRTITSSDPSTGIITLDSPIAKPITVAESPVFAVEVALLNRRIVFEADGDADDESIGGHFIVHHTASKQHIEGVEIRNFGQMGRLGKYPLHFHMCGDSPESIVKKNVVRDSNQRCYVIHGTNNVTIEENVAYNAFGHCYFLEDGNEEHNVFRRNLGSGIKIMPQDRVDLLSAAKGRVETDGAPFGFNGASVFWISNPMNYFYGNVAAGGEKNGYWFETHGSTRHMSLGAFEDNEVHSSHAFAFSVYHPGWRPNEVALIKNLKVYRNPTWGAFLHVTTNLYFEGGIFADNGDIAAMINRGDDLVFDGTIFVGKTPFTPAHCNPATEKVGISIHGFRLAETVRGSFSGQVKGLTAKNVHFVDWSPAATQCDPTGGSLPLKMNFQQSFIKAMNAYHNFENILVDDTSSPVIDTCMGDSGIDDVSIEISSDQSGAFTGSAGFLVSPKVGAMVDGGCSEYNDCLHFCDGACLRTITVVAGDGAFSEQMVMIVTETVSGKTITIDRDVLGHPGPNPVSNNVADAYTVVLPSGSYIARFERISSPGTLVWPGYAEPIFEAAPSCSNYVTESDFSLVKPTDTTRQECNELILNGDFDSGEWGVEGWNGYHNWPVQWLETGGVDGTGALALTFGSPEGSCPNQVIDTTCLQEGDELEIQVSFKVVDKDLQSIDPGTVLPYVRAKTDVFNAADPSNKYWQHTAWETLASTTVAPADGIGGWGSIQGTYIVSSAVGNADRLNVHVVGSPDHLIIDNFSIRKVASRRRGLRASV